jgi:uncharacterized protein (TIGR04222 family)
MDQPWGISGPEFLIGYLVLLGCCIAYTRGVRARLGEAEAGDRAAPELDVYEAAYLADGPGRAVDTAVATLVGRGTLRATRNGMISCPDGAPPGDHPVECAVRGALDGVPPMFIVTLRRRLAGHRRLNEIRDRLGAAGLRVTDAQVRRYRQSLWVFAALGAFGVVRLVNGIRLERPVGLLALLLAGTVLCAFLCALKPVRTRRGAALLADLRARARPKSGACPDLAWAGVGALALFGPGDSLLDPELAHTLAIQKAESSSRSGKSSCGGYVGGSSGGGGGGGSSCGGGGGCGG